jgi:hypothetical protein
LTVDEVAEIVAATEPPDATSLRHRISPVLDAAASRGCPGSLSYAAKVADAAAGDPGLSQPGSPTLRDEPYLT